MSGRKQNGRMNGLGGDTPFHDAASVVIRRRLGAVAEAVERLSRSRDEGTIEADDIHQVRVSVRRASAALSVFGACVRSRKRLEKVNRRLKRLRRAVGIARTCDVGLAILGHDRGASGQAERPDLCLAERTLQRRRKRSMRAVRRALERCSPERLRKWGRRLAAATVEAMSADDPSSPVTLLDSAQGTIGSLLLELHKRSAGGMTSPDSLHEMRLSAKRLRYATEVFGPCFEPARLDDAARVLIDVQDRLGAVNDLSEMVGLIDQCAVESEADVDVTGLRRQYAERYEESRASFISWWNQAGERALLLAYAEWSVPASEEPAPIIHVASSRPRIAPITPGVNGSQV